MCSVQDRKRYIWASLSTILSTPLCCFPATQRYLSAAEYVCVLTLQFKLYGWIWFFCLFRFVFVLLLLLFVCLFLFSGIVEKHAMLSPENCQRKGWNSGLPTVTLCSHPPGQKSFTGPGKRLMKSQNKNRPLKVPPEA